MEALLARDDLLTLRACRGTDVSNIGDPGEKMMLTRRWQASSRIGAPLTGVISILSDHMAEVTGTYSVACPTTSAF